MKALQTTDIAIKKIMDNELARQQNGLEMIPSENFVSLAVLEALGSVLTNKYSEGYPGKRYYGGNQYIDQIEELCRTRAKELFGVEHVNVQPYSGSPANQAVYFALLNPGDTVLGMELAQGGHLTHGYQLNFSGRFYKSVGYGVDKKTERLDYDVIRKIALQKKPKLIICGATAYPRTIDFAAFRSIADEVGAYLLADISHITGLVISGDHQSPIPYADIVTTTTHKTLRGPRGAIILVPKIVDRFHEQYHNNTKRDLAGLVDASIMPGLQGGPHNHQTAAIAVALKEAQEPSFIDYGHNIVKNTHALAEALVSSGLTLVTGGTDNHLVLINLLNTSISGKIAETLLDEVGITVNKNMIPYDPKSPMDPSGIRLGTPALTSRGFTEDDMRRIGKIIASILQNPESATIKDEARTLAKELTNAHPLYPELTN